MFVSPLKIIQDQKCFLIYSIQTSEKQMNMYKKKCEVFSSHFPVEIRAFDFLFI